MTWNDLIGDNRSLGVLEMSIRAVLVFIVALILIRIAGRRSFGLHAPFDNIILILLGAILSRAVVGASPLIPTLCASLVICILHRLLAWLGFYSLALTRLLKGSKISIYEKGHFLKKNMHRSLVTKEDVMEAVRLHFHSESLDSIEKLFMEGSGQISGIRKEKKGSS